MTLTIENVTPHVHAWLIQQRVRFTVADPETALTDEIERGKKYRLGSVKHAAHLVRLKALEEVCQRNELPCPDSSSSIPTKALSPSSGSHRASEPLACSSKSALGSAPEFSDAQTAAIGMLIQMEGAKRKDAEAAVRRVPDGDAKEIWAQARGML